MKLETSPMRKLILAVAVVLAIAAAYGLGRHNANFQTGNRAGRRVLYYVDPMHPAYKSDKPGIAPDCGMQLEPVYAEGGPSDAPATGGSAPDRPGTVRIDSGKQQLGGIKTS